MLRSLKARISKRLVRQGGKVRKSNPCRIRIRVMPVRHPDPAAEVGKLTNRRTLGVIGAVALLPRSSLLKGTTWFAIGILMLKLMANQGRPCDHQDPQHHDDQLHDRDLLLTPCAMPCITPSNSPVAPY